MMPIESSKTPLGTGFSLFSRLFTEKDLEKQAFKKIVSRKPEFCFGRVLEI